MNTVVQIRKSAVSFGDSISFLFIAQEYSRGALSSDAELPSWLAPSYLFPPVPSNSQPPDSQPCRSRALRDSTHDAFETGSKGNCGSLKVVTRVFALGCRSWRSFTMPQQLKGRALP